VYLSDAKARPFLLLVSQAFLERFLSDIWRGGREKNKNKTLFPHFSKVSSSDFQSGG
jgi:hypothetical protein